MKFRGRTIGFLVAGTMLALAGGYAVAADTTPAEIVKMRHDHMKDDIGASFKAIIDQLKTGMPDKKIVGDAAAKMAAMSRELPKWFPKGSGPESGVKTLAKAEIWTTPDDFKAAADKLTVETDKLVQVAATGDVAALADQVKATGGACQGCHKPFREPPPPAN